MDIDKLDQATLNLLQKAFEMVLEQNKVPYKKIGIVEEADQFAFLYEAKNGKVHVFKWKKAACVDVSIGVLAQSVLAPIIPHLRMLS